MTPKQKKLRKIADERDKLLATINSAQVRLEELNTERQNIIMSQETRR